MIYYGDEIGMSGGKDPGSAGERFPGIPDAWNMELYKWVKSVNSHAQELEPALRSPEYDGVVTDDAAGVYAYRRGAGRDSIVVAAQQLRDARQGLSVPWAASESS